MSLEHLDSVIGLRMMGGDEALYKKFLDDFLSTNSPEVGRLEDLMQSDENLLKRKVHTIKGQAGTIGATKLQNLAEGIERQMSREKVQAFCREFNLLAEELNREFQFEQDNSTLAQVAASENSEPEQNQNVEELFTELESSLVRGKPLVINRVVTTLEKCQLSIKDQTLLVELQNLVKQYQFKSAAQVIQMRKSSYY